MADWTASVLRMRTTSSGGGNIVGIVTGMGATPGQALAALRQQAEQLSQQAGEKAAEAADLADQKAAEQKALTAKETEDRRRTEEQRRRRESGGRGFAPLEPRHPAQPPETASVAPARRHWWFEVIDVRLTSAPQDAQASGWLAYGTLTFEGAPPQANTAGSAQTGTGPARGSRGDRIRGSRSPGGRAGP